MSWAAIDPDLRALIRRVCTPKEIDALKLKAAGAGTRKIARALGVSPSSIRDRLDAAERKIRKAREAM